MPSPDNSAPVERLEGLGVRVLIVNTEPVDEILAATRTITDAVGVPERGAQLVERIRRDLDAVTAWLAGAARPRLLLLVGRSPFIAAGRGTYQDELIELAHGDNLAAATGAHWPNVSLEFIVARAPEVIIDASMGSEEATDRAGALSFWTDFPTIPAVRDRRIHGYRAYELLRPGPRVAETLTRIARFIHPERFAAEPTVAPAVPLPNQ